MLRRGILSVLAGGALLVASACSDKTAPGAADAGDAGVRARDAAAEGGAVDAGADDLALPPPVNEEIAKHDRTRH